MSVSVSRPEPVSVYGLWGVAGSTLPGGAVPPSHVASLPELFGNIGIEHRLPSVDSGTGRRNCRRKPGNQLRTGNGGAMRGRGGRSTPPTAWCSDGNAPPSGSVRKPDSLHRPPTRPGLRPADSKHQQPTTGGRRRAATNRVSAHLLDSGSLLRVMSTGSGHMRRRPGGVRSPMLSDAGHGQLHRKLRSGNRSGTGI